MTEGQTPDTSGSTEHRASRESIDRIIADYIDRLIAGERLNRQGILGDHPECAEEILTELEMFLQLDSDRDAPSPLGTLGDYTLRCQVGRARQRRPMKWG